MPTYVYKAVTKNGMLVKNRVEEAKLLVLSNLLLRKFLLRRLKNSGQALKKERLTQEQLRCLQTLVHS